MKRTLARGAAGIAGVLLLLLIALVPSALADGNETLGPPSVDIAKGTGVATGGTGLGGQLHLNPPNPGTGTIEVAVPDGAAVKQVLLHWEGQHTQGAGDDTLNVNGNEVTGQLIGRSFFVNTSTGSPTGTARDIYSSTYRADVTALNLVSAGDNSVAVSGAAFDFANNGASLTVIFDDDGDKAVIALRDGNDVSFVNWPEPRRSTVPQEFTFAPAPVTRTAQLDLHVASVAPNRPNVINLTVGGEETQIVNELGDTAGPEWDTLTLPVVVPAGVTSVKVSVQSRADDTGRLPASLVWVGAAFSIDACPPASTIPQKTQGRAWGADVELLGIKLVNKLGDVSSRAPGTPKAKFQLAQVNLLNLVKVGLVTNRSNSTLQPHPTTTASSTIASVELLGGLVKTGVIRAVSQSSASGKGASYNSHGSTIADLRINGATVANVKPGAKLVVKDPLLGGSLAEVHVYEEKGTSSAAKGEARASHSVNMLRVVLLKPFLTLPKGAQIIVGHAESSAQSPLSVCPKTGTVSGEAFTAYVSAKLLGSPLAHLKVGNAVLPPTGGSDSDGAIVNVPGIVTSKTAHNTTRGSLKPHPNATSRSVVEDLNILNGLITARVLDVKSTSRADGTNAGTTFESTLLDLRIAGLTVQANAKPNTTVTVPLPGGGSVVVVINEQVVNTNGTTSTDGTVNALHVYLYGPLGLLDAEVIVASAHSDAHVGKPADGSDPGTKPPAKPGTLVPTLPDVTPVVQAPLALIDKVLPPVVKKALKVVPAIKAKVLVKVPIVLNKAQVALLKKADVKARVRVQILSGKTVVAVRVLKVVRLRATLAVKLVPGRKYTVRVIANVGVKAKPKIVKRARVKVVATPKAKVKAKAVLV